MSNKPKQSERETQELIAKFEHELDVNFEKLDITRSKFEGRLGDPKTVLKRNLVRFFSHYVNELVTDRASAEKAATAMHASDLARAVGKLQGLGHPDEYLEKRLKRLVPGIDIEGGQRLAPDITEGGV